MSNEEDLLVTFSEAEPWLCRHYLSDQVTNMWNRQDAPTQTWLCYIISWYVLSSSCLKQFQWSWFRFAPSSISKTRVLDLQQPPSFHANTLSTFTLRTRTEPLQTDVCGLKHSNHSCSTDPVFGENNTAIMSQNKGGLAAGWCCR